MPNTLTKGDVTWALSHLALEGDTDLFPKAFEIDILRAHEAEVVPEVLKLDLAQYKWHEPRRTLVPTAELGFRAAAQLDPFDALLFAALVRHSAPGIERYRGDPQGDRIFSYRFSRLSGRRFYEADRYKLFWAKSKEKAATCTAVLATDITDFYNQIYHHTVEQELACARVKPATAQALLSLFKTCSSTTSRGLPIGPHATHLLAELTLHPIDEMLVQSGIDYVRFVDDIHIFCGNQRDARERLYKLAGALDLVKLLLNRSKTKVVSAADWSDHCDRMIDDHPINDEEERIVSIISGGGGNPYVVASVSDVPPGLDAVLDEDSARSVFEAYLAEHEPDFVRLRWFIRRMTQVGSPAAVEYVVDNFERLTPAAADAVRYLRATIERYDGSHKELGEKLLRALDGAVIGSSPYLRSMLLSLFSAVATLDHVPSLTGRFDSLDAMGQREVVRAALHADYRGWLRSLKGLGSQDPWVRRAVTLASASWSDDERVHWAKSQKNRYEFVDNLIAADLSKRTAGKEMRRKLSRRVKVESRRVR